MGLALALLLVLLAGAAPQETPMEALRRENDAIQALLAQPETREEGRLAFQAFVERLSADPSTDPALLFHRAKKLATDSSLTPDPLRRAHWYDVASGAAARTGNADSALSFQVERARILADAGALDEAALALDSALQVHSGASRQRPLALVALADLLRRSGRFDAALERARAAEALADGDPAAMLVRDTAVLVRSAIARDVGSPEQIEPELEALASDVATRLARGAVDPSHVTNVRIELLRVAIARGDHARVRRDAQALLDDAALCRVDAERAQVLLHLGASWLELERGQRESGQEPERRARAFFEQALQLEPGPADAYFLRTRLATEALESGDLARCLAELQALRGIAPEAVPLTTRVEGPVLEARLALAQPAPHAELLGRRDDLLHTWDDLARAWRSAPRDAQGVAFLKYSHRRAVLSQLAQLELALQPGEAGVERAFEHLLAAQELSSLAGARAGAPVTLAGLRRDLLTSARHGLLVYLPARDRSHVFAVDRGAITHHDLPRSSRLEEVRREYVTWLFLDGVQRATGAQRAELVREERARAALAALLLPDDVRARVRDWESWSISGTDTLGLTPFEWLPFDREPFLGCTRAIDVVPSLPHAIRTAQLGSPTPAQLDLVLLADARPGAAVEAGWPGLERVELGADARAALEQVYARERLRILTGDLASGAELGHLELAHVAVLQFLVHAVEERSTAAPVAFALTPDAATAGDDGLFRSAEIAHLDGAPALVVLTACSSGQGPTRRGDPLVGSAAGAWLAHGARAAIVSQQELTLGEARRTTRVLHAALARGATPAEALRDVRADLARDEPDLAPFQHALQQVIGLGHVPLFPRAGEPQETERSAADDAPGLGRVQILALVAIAFVLGVGLSVALHVLRQRRAAASGQGPQTR